MACSGQRGQRGGWRRYGALRGEYDGNTMHANETELKGSLDAFAPKEEGEFISRKGTLGNSSPLPAFKKGYAEATFGHLRAKRSVDTLG